MDRAPRRTHISTDRVQPAQDAGVAAFAPTVELDAPLLREQ